ncbi:GAF domain-containing sensor histidine kinase [Thermocoleostomius sinensis]|uniref:histidine kinase n=1 Tax=Thermocoleostomius sinensis A174 TaxID=2016057 RepID=A0A9E8Z8Z5_9CYAN|nr:GAF domain-containing protein [Thermocoleostomius sinensis]WAL58507.1 GAF domain-containing protein [Thermocoleostomius sinensis A174]
MTISPLPNCQLQVEQENLLRHVTDRIRQSLELQEILDATVVEVRAFLQTDRILIYKFYPNHNGQVVAESVDRTRLPSLLGLNFPADDIPLHARELFIQARVRSVVDVESGQIGQSSANNLNVGESSLQYRSLDPCHAEYLTAMGVKSSMVVPVFYHEQLWGLLVSHHADSKVISEALLQGIQLVVDQLSVAITQSMLLQQVREKADREATINRITTLLHSLPTIELQKALDETVAALQGSGGRLFVQGGFFKGQYNAEGILAGSSPNLYISGAQPTLPDRAKWPYIEQYSGWTNHFQTVGDFQPWAITDLYETPSLRNLQSFFQTTPIRSLLIVPLWIRQQWVGYLSLFRNEIETETLWAGQFDPDERQRYPRLSFDVWRESKSGQVHPWSDGDIQLVKNLGHQFASAIEQNELYQRIQSLNLTLETQVQERTIELQQATEQQKILFEVVTEMRKSLDLSTIFATVTRRVRRILQVDRVGVYQFDLDSDCTDGKFVAEKVSSKFSSALEIRIHDHCFGELYQSLYQQGRLLVINDIHHANLQNCHISILNRFQVKALIVAPLLKGEFLWGLLCIHQCAHVREWKPSEIQFVSQVAEQLSVALAQADLLAQTQSQANQLAQTLRELQQAQAQLIQTEKMSSLGQLVAGVAHEINNPVNFIYGNLNYIASYTEDLLSLTQLHQQHYSEIDTTIREKAEAIDLDFISEDLPKIIASMKIGADRIRQIVLSLRNFSRLDQAEMKLVNIHEGIDSTLLILQHRLRGKPDVAGIELIKTYGDLPLVECYAGQLNQVFMNLISNAIDSLEEWNLQRSPQSIAQQPAIIRICTEALNNERVAIRISDNGMGMSEAVRSHLFDPFFTTKPVGKGTGLGLSISYQIITDKHGGQLRCVSAPGQGAEFIIEIPIRQPSPTTLI